MAIVTFWSESKKEIGQTATAVAVATQMAIDHNYKILLVGTQYANTDIERAFWDIGKQKKKFGSLFGGEHKVSLEAGMEGLTKAVASNRMKPELTTNYTKIVFKDRLEVLECFKGIETDYSKVQNMYQEIIQISSQYYDMIFVDLDKGLSQFTNQILNISDVIVYGTDQRMITIKQYQQTKEKGFLMNKQNDLVYCGDYHPDSKYNMKNIARYLKLKDSYYPIYRATLYTEAMEEGLVADYFLKIRTLKEEDKNVQLAKSVKELSISIIDKVKEQQMKR